MVSSKKFTFGFLKIVKTSDFLPFALIISSDESQSRAQFNLPSLGENKTGYRAENTICFVTYSLFPQIKHNIVCFHRLKPEENSTFVCIAFLYPPENVLPCKAVLVHYQLVTTFMLCYC